MFINLNLFFVKNVRILIHIKEIGRNNIFRIMLKINLSGYNKTVTILDIIFFRNVIILTLICIKNLLIVNI